jgi:integrase
MRAHHGCSRIVVCLKTKSGNAAVKGSQALAQKLDDYWLSLRIQQAPIPSVEACIANSQNASIDAPCISDALAAYLALKGFNKSEVFTRTATRNVEYLIEEFGDRPIGEYSSSDAARFRDALFERGLASNSVKRIFASVRSIVQLTISEQGLEIKNAFRGTYLPDKDDKRSRQPIPLDGIRDIQRQCRDLDDDMRWLVALISDTGMRLAEAVGLLVSDLVLEEEVPYINVQTHAWRPLKTKANIRKIPLVGEALWAAERIGNNAISDIAFPRYCDGKRTQAGSASAALNKWLKPRVPEGCVVHSFRHSLRDRLRAVECPADIVDQIGGWSTSGVGQSYGKGYPLKTLEAWLGRIEEGCS